MTQGASQSCILQETPTQLLLRWSLKTSSLSIYATLDVCQRA